MSSLALSSFALAFISIPFALLCLRHVYWSSFHCSDEVSEAGNIIKKDAMFWLVVLEVQDPESTSGVALV